MKKLIATLLAITSLHIANAQLAALPKVQIGLKGGANYASLTHTTGDAITAYHIGAFAKIGAKKISLQPEVVYSVQGIEDLKLNYVNVPIMVQYKFAKLFYAEAGPQFGFLTNSKDNYKNSNMSIAAGLGLKLPILPLGAYVRYNFGVTHANETSNTLNNVGQIGITWNLFGI